MGFQIEVTVAFSSGVSDSSDTGFQDQRDRACQLMNMASPCIAYRHAVHAVKVRGPSGRWGRCRLLWACMGEQEHLPCILLQAAPPLADAGHLHALRIKMHT